MRDHTKLTGHSLTVFKGDAETNEGLEVVDYFEAMTQVEFNDETDRIRFLFEGWKSAGDYDAGRRSRKGLRYSYLIKGAEFTTLKNTTNVIQKFRQASRLLAASETGLTIVAADWKIGELSLDFTNEVIYSELLHKAGDAGLISTASNYDLELAKADLSTAIAGFEPYAWAIAQANDNRLAMFS